MVSKPKPVHIASSLVLPSVLLLHLLVQDPAQDNLSVTLNIPELHECTATLSPSSMTIAPGASQSGNLVLTNDGNSDWTVGFGKSEQRQIGSHPRLVNGVYLTIMANGQAAISFDVTPDDSMAANTATEIRIRGLDGNNERCYDLDRHSRPVVRVQVLLSVPITSPMLNQEHLTQPA